MAAEIQRRVLLAESDLLLEDVETLRLNEALEAPLRMREAIRAMQIRLGRRNPPLPPATPASTHARRLPWPSPAPPGTTTGCCSRTRTGSVTVSSPRAGGLLEILPQLVGLDRRIRRTDSRREELQEVPQAHVVQHRRRLDD